MSRIKAGKSKVRKIRKMLVLVVKSMYSRVPNNRVVLNKRDLRKISDFFCV